MSVMLDQLVINRMPSLQCALTEMSRAFAQQSDMVSFVAKLESGLAALLCRAVGLAPALPSQVTQDCEVSVASQLEGHRS